MDVRLACHTNLDMPVSLSFTVSMLRQRSEVHDDSDNSEL